jgi:hypothetical protein
MRSPQFYRLGIVLLAETQNESLEGHARNGGLVGRHRCHRWGVVFAGLDVVEANNGHVFGDAKSAG